MSIESDHVEELHRFVDWANWLAAHTAVTLQEAFDRLCLLFAEVHYGVCRAELENFEDLETGNDAPAMQYLNAGETYAPTIILTDDYVNGRKLLVTSWGDWYEQNEQYHCKQSQVVRCGNCSHFTQFIYAVDDWNNHRCAYCGKNVSGGDYIETP